MMDKISFLKDGIAYTKIPTYGGTYVPASGVAKIMRTYLKRKLRNFAAYGVCVRKASEDSIYVYVQAAEDRDLTIHRMKELRTLCNQFEAGKFNAMEDIYEYGNKEAFTFEYDNERKEATVNNVLILAKYGFDENGKYLG